MASMDAAVALGGDGVGISVGGIGVFEGRGTDFVGIPVGVGVAVRVSTGALQAASVKMLIITRMKTRHLSTILPSEYLATGFDPSQVPLNVSLIERSEIFTGNHHSGFELSQQLIIHIDTVFPIRITAQRYGGTERLKNSQAGLGWIDQRVYLQVDAVIRIRGSHHHA